MAYSYTSYTGNGTTTQFSVPFPYIRKEHVTCTVGAINTAFTWVNSTTIQLASAPGNGIEVIVRRTTPVATRLVDYTDGSTLVAADLDTDSLQHLYTEQELTDNVGPVADIRGVYYGAYAADPVLSPFGGPLSEGDLYFNTTTDRMRVYSAAAWIDATAVAAVIRWRKTAAGGETSLSGLDDSSPAQSLFYDPGFEQLFLNGVMLARGTEYVATTGTSVTGLAALTAGDFVEILAYSRFTVTQVDGSALMPGTVVTSKLADSAVTTAKIDNGAVTASKIAAGAVESAGLADGAVVEAKLASSAVAEAKIATGAVTETKLASNAVTAAKIANSAVTGAKLNTGGAGVNGQLLTSDGAGGISWTTQVTGLPGTLLNTQTFNASGTWTKPASGTWALIRCWGGGGSGGRGNALRAGGGGGGACVEKLIALSSLGATETVTIGAGGTVPGAAATAGNPGGNTTFGSWVTAYGGGGGGAGAAASGYGGGGGGGAGAGISGGTTIAGGGGADIVTATKAFDTWLVVSAAKTTAPTAPGTFAVSTSFVNTLSAAGTAGGPSGNNNNSSYGGGGGGDSSEPGGSSVWGGGGGGGSTSSTTSTYPGGTSTYGGAGGASGNNAPTAGTAGSQPGGGGGGSYAAASLSGAGGAGRCIVYVY